MEPDATPAPAPPAWATQPPPDPSHAYAATWGVPFWTPPPPSHPRSTAAMVLGIIAVAAGIVLAFPLLLSPLAWYYGAFSMREIDREPGRWSGRGQAKAGLVLGIVGSVLMVIGLFLVLIVTLLAVVVSTYDSGYPS